MKAILCTFFLLAGCYKTQVGTHDPSVPTHTDRQWFTLNGYTPLSDPSGQQCPDGVTYAETKLSGTDIAIDLGLRAVGLGIGIAACELPEDPTTAEASNFSQCMAVAGAILPALIASRTVRYQCR